jgi:carbon storage regulator CsrA
MSRDRSRAKTFELPHDPNQHFDLRGLNMKVFSRCENESLLIGNDMKVTILSIGSDHVRLAIFCPRLVPAYREETLYWNAEEEQPLDLELISAARA